VWIIPRTRVGIRDQEEEEDEEVREDEEEADEEEEVEVEEEEEGREEGVLLPSSSFTAWMRRGIRSCRHRKTKPGKDKTTPPSPPPSLPPSPSSDPGVGGRAG
jgi:hypothetical protein